MHVPKCCGLYFKSDPVLKGLLFSFLAKLVEVNVCFRKKELSLLTTGPIVQTIVSPTCLQPISKWVNTKLCWLSVEQYVTRTRLTHWVTCLHPTCVTVGRHIGSRTSAAAVGAFEYIPRQIPEMAIKRNFTSYFTSEALWASPFKENVLQHFHVQSL